MTDAAIVDALHLVNDNLALLFYKLQRIEERLDAIEEDQRLNWALMRQTWLNPAPGFVRRGPLSTPVRQERAPSLVDAAKAKTTASGVEIPALEE